jgi:acetoin utilization deacetylase AcuC-like enzyme
LNTSRPFDLERSLWDTVYLDILNRTLAGAQDDVRPDFILLQACVNAHVDDRLGRLALTDAGLVRRNQMVAQAAGQRFIPLVSTLGGGYGADRDAVARRHARSILTLGSS